MKKSAGLFLQDHAVAVLPKYTCFVLLHAPQTWDAGLFEKASDEVQQRNRPAFMPAADVSWILSDWEDELDALRNAEALPSEQHSSGCHSEEEGLTRITVSADGTVSPAACVYTDFSTIPELNQCIHEAINGTEVPKLMTFSDKGAQQSPKCIYFNPEGVRMH